MWSHKALSTIDIGSSKIRTIIWHLNEQGNDFSIFWIWVASSNAVRKWNILDMEEFKNNLDKSLEEAEKMAWEQISWVYISFNSSSFEVMSSKWVVAVSSDEISTEDIWRSIDMAKNGLDLPNREVLKIIPEYFIVDSEKGVKNPVWMSARRLEIVSNVFSMNTNVLNNIKKSVSDVGIEIYDIYPNILSSPEWVLTKRQKELWVVCIDIWGATTWVTVYEEWVLKFSSVIPIWWDNTTNDVALWLRTSIEIAEKLKLDHWKLELEDDEDFFKDENIDISKLNIWEEESFSLLYLSKILTARYEEILIFVKQELQNAWKDWILPEGAIFVGWWAKMKGLTKLSKKILRLPSFIWIPASKDDLSDASINDPVFSAVIWTMILANKYSDFDKNFSLKIWWIFKPILNLFKKILP